MQGMNIKVFILFQGRFVPPNGARHKTKSAVDIVIWKTIRGQLIGSRVISL
jgi:hypothetical protein